MTAVTHDTAEIHDALREARSIRLLIESLECDLTEAITGALRSDDSIDAAHVAIALGLPEPKGRVDESWEFERVTTTRLSPTRR